MAENGARNRPLSVVCRKTSEYLKRTSRSCFRAFFFSEEYPYSRFYFQFSSKKHVFDVFSRFFRTLGKVPFFAAFWTLFWTTLVQIWGPTFRNRRFLDPFSSFFFCVFHQKSGTFFDDFYWFWSFHLFLAIKQVKTGAILALPARFLLSFDHFWSLLTYFWPIIVRFEPFQSSFTYFCPTFDLKSPVSTRFCLTFAYFCLLLTYFCLLLTYNRQFPIALARKAAILTKNRHFWQLFGTFSTKMALFWLQNTLNGKTAVFRVFRCDFLTHFDVFYRFLAPKIDENGSRNPLF